MTDDLVVRLQEAIEVRERAARQAPFDPYKIHVDQPEDGPHIRLHDPQSVLRLCQSLRDIIAMFPVSAPHLDTEGSFYGFQSRDCGEHRTVGAHRAWCYDCSEWCYPKAPCARCHGVSEVLRALARGYGLEV